MSICQIYSKLPQVSVLLSCDEKLALINIRITKDTRMVLNADVMCPVSLDKLNAKIIEVLRITYGAATDLDGLVEGVTGFIFQYMEVDGIIQFNKQKWIELIDAWNIYEFRKMIELFELSKRLPLEEAIELVSNEFVIKPVMNI